MSIIRVNFSKQTDFIEYLFTLGSFWVCYFIVLKFVTLR